MREQRNLTCNLTGDEIKKYGVELAEKQSELRTVEADKKTKTAEFSEKISEVKLASALLSKKILDKTEKRKVECVREPDYEARVFRWVRQDTGEVIETERMESGDLQIPIPGHESERIPRLPRPIESVTGA